ncbi:MAG: histidine kinase, partial [Polyangiaceae bacterium]
MTGLLAAGLSGLAIFVSMSITASFIWFGENTDSAVPRARFDAVAAVLPALAPVITLLLVLVLSWRRSRIDEPLSRSLRRALLVGAGAWAAGSGLAVTFNPAVDAAGLAWFAPTVVLVAAVGVAAGRRAARRERRVMEAVHAMREARDLNEVLAAAAAVVDGRASAPLMILGVVEDEGEEVGGAGDARAVRVVLLATTAPLATPPGAAVAQLPSWMVLLAGQGRWLDDRDLQVDERAQLRRQGIAACRWFPVHGAGQARGLLGIPAASVRRSSRARWLELVAHIEAQWQKLGLIARERASALQRERERVADAIHDNLAQDLAAAVISLETASIEARRQAPALAEHLDRALGSARQSLREARRLVESGAAGSGEDLAPEAAAVAPVLEEVCRSWTRDTGVPATLEQAGDPAVVGRDAGALLLRTLREALVNVRKHA